VIASWDVMQVRSTGCVAVEEVAKWFAANPWGILLLAGCTIVGVLIGVWGLYVTYLQSREKRPTYLTSSNNLIRGLVRSLPDLEVSYRGHGGAVENLTVTHLTFWNKGRAAIRKGDIAKKQPLILRMANNSLILDMEFPTKSGHGVKG
jgi:hypothetical protein